MAYSPISLAEIYSQANHLKAQDRYSQLADLQYQQAQRQQQQQDTIDAAVANPNASLADYSKAGLQGVQAYGQMQQAQLQMDTLKARKIFSGANDILIAPDPVAAARQAAPDYVKHYEEQHGAGSFDALGADGVREIAMQLRDHSYSVLVDPDKQFQAQSAADLARYNQEGRGGELDRMNAENARNANTVGATIRGQNLTNARALEANKNAQTTNNLNQAGKLRDDYDQIVAKTGWHDLQGFYQRMQQTVKDPSPAGDIGLIFSYMKVLDPGSTVREGEYATAGNAGSAFDKAGSLYNRVLNGQRLTESQRADFFKKAGQYYQSAKARQDAIQKDFSTKAQRAGLNPDDVIVNYGQPAAAGLGSPTAEDPLGIR